MAWLFLFESTSFFCINSFSILRVGSPLILCHLCFSRFGSEGSLFSFIVVLGISIDHLTVLALGFPFSSLWVSNPSLIFHCSSTFISFTVSKFLLYFIWNCGLTNQVFGLELALHFYYDVVMHGDKCQLQICPSTFWTNYPVANLFGVHIYRATNGMEIFLIHVYITRTHHLHWLSIFKLLT